MQLERIERTVQEIRHQPIKSSFHLVLATTALKVAYDFFNWRLLDQISEINCSLYAIALKKFNLFDNFCPQELYCYGVLLKKAVLEEETYGSTSHLAAIQSLEKAAELGLTLGKAELCRPSTFYGVDMNKIDADKLQQFCCPNETPGLCPWEPLLLQQYKRSDYRTDRSTNDQRVLD